MAAGLAFALGAALGISREIKNGRKGRAKTFVNSDVCSSEVQLPAKIRPEVLKPRRRAAV